MGQGIVHDQMHVLLGLDLTHVCSASHVKQVFHCLNNFLSHDFMIIWNYNFKIILYHRQTQCQPITLMLWVLT